MPIPRSFRRQDGHILAAYEDPPLVRRVDTQQELQQQGLAGTGRANHSEVLALLYLESHVPDGEFGPPAAHMLKSDHVPLSLAFVSRGMALRITNIASATRRRSAARGLVYV